MKILHICTYDTGGAAIAAIRFHKALLKEGIDSKILFTKKRRQDNPESYEYQFPPKRFIKSVAERVGRFLHLYKSKWESNQLKLRGRIEGFEYFSFPTSDYDITTQKIYQEADIINLHWVAGFLDYSFLKTNTKPVVWTLHDMNPFTGGCHSSMGCNLFTSLCESCPQLAGTKNPKYSDWIHNYKTKYLNHSNLKVACLSDRMFHYSSSSRLFKDFLHFRINHIIDFKTFQIYNKVLARKIFNLPEDKIVFLSLIERFNSGKGYDILISLVNEIDNDNFVFCNAGKKPDTERIIYVGNISDERFLAVLYSAVDAVIIPSREENLY